MANIDIPIGTSNGSINTAIAGANPGDTIRFERGGSWVGVISVSVSGSSGNHITLGAYGSGAKPILTTRTSLPGFGTAGNWTDLTGNVWRKALSINSQNTNYRFWLNGTEYNRSETSATVNVTKRTSYNVDQNAFLYVYATSNPATFYTTIEYNGTDVSPLLLANLGYVTVQDLDIRGGTGSCIELEFASNIIIENNNIGTDAGRIAIRRSGTSNNVIIRDNTIDSGDRLMDDFLTDKGISDGIHMTSGASEWKIYRNWIRDWGHSCVEMQNVSGTITNNEIYDNKLTAEFVDYCRGIGFDSAAGQTATGNKIYRNFIDKTSVRVQLNTPGLEFYNNIINETRNSLTGDAGIGNGILLAGYSNTSPINMKIYNNIIANCESEGLRIDRASGYNMPTGNDITNNIFYNNGDLTPFDFDGPQIIILENPSDVSGNTFRNNLLYKSGVTDLVYDSRSGGDFFMTVAEFNARNGTDSDVITGNIGGDPLFVDDNADFALQSGSPALNAGITLGSPYDIALIASTWPSDVNTGSQSGAWNLGAYVEAVSTQKIIVSGGKILTRAGKILITN